MLKWAHVSAYRLLDDIEDLLRSGNECRQGIKPTIWCRVQPITLAFSGRVLLGYDDEGDDMYANVFNLKTHIPEGSEKGFCRVETGQQDGSVCRCVLSAWYLTCYISGWHNRGCGDPHQ